MSNSLIARTGLVIELVLSRVPRARGLSGPAKHYTASEAGPKKNTRIRGFPAQGLIPSVQGRAGCCFYPEVSLKHPHHIGRGLGYSRGGRCLWCRYDEIADDTCRILVFYLMEKAKCLAFSRFYPWSW